MSSNVVVPFAEIAALLQDRLSGTEIDNLLDRLIRTRTRIVQPGDLITAEWAMDVLNRLALLEQGADGRSTSALNAKVAKTLLQTFQGFSRLAAQKSFLPDGTGNDALQAAIALTNGFQNVAMFAAAGASMALVLDREGLVEVFGQLYQGEHDLGVLLNSNIPGVSNPTPRLLFAQRLNALLDVNDGVTGALSLKNAVSQKDVEAAIAVQNRINGIALTESGEAIVGNIQVTYQGSTRGETLVIDDRQAFGYIFRVTNKTNKLLKIQLAKEFLPPKQSWSSSATIVGGEGRTLDLKPFDSANPTDSSTFQDVQVNVITPSGTSSGDIGVLKVRAFVPPPVNVSGPFELPLTVGTVGGPAQRTFIRFDSSTPTTVAGNPNSAQIDDPVELQYSFQFTTDTMPNTRDFRFRIESTNPSSDMALFGFDFITAGVQLDSAASTPAAKVSTVFQVTAGQPKSVTIQVLPLTGSSGKTLNLKCSVVATDDQALSDTKAKTIKVQ